MSFNIVSALIFAFFVSNITTFKTLRKLKSKICQFDFGIGAKMVSKGLIITVVGVMVAIIVGVATIESTEASIDYYLEKPDTLMRGVDHVTAYCENGGGMDGDFNLVVTFTNATFSHQTAFPYEQVGNSTVKFGFVLHKGESNLKVIYLSPDNATTEFSIKLTLERTDINSFLFLKANAMYPTQLSYKWNETNNCFNCVNAT